MSSSCSGHSDFNPRTPCGVRHPAGPVVQHRRVISIHAPLAGCDPLGGALQGDQGAFQSTLPWRGATRNHGVISFQAAFQSTHPLRGATCLANSSNRNSSRISIHAPLAGCDVPACIYMQIMYYFNPRTPCGVRPRTLNTTTVCKNFNPRTPCGVRLSICYSIGRPIQFQSTHPLRGATYL